MSESIKKQCLLILFMFFCLVIFLQAEAGASPIHEITSAVSEPAAMFVSGFGLIGIAGFLRKFKKE